MWKYVWFAETLPDYHKMVSVGLRVRVPTDVPPDSIMIGLSLKSLRCLVDQDFGYFSNNLKNVELTEMWDN